MSPTKQLILGTDQNAYLAPVQGWKQSVQKLESRTETFKGYVDKPGGTYWEGQFAEAAQQNAGDGLKTVGSIRDTVDALADEVTSTVTYSVLPPLTAAKAIINHAEQQQGVTVNDDLSMTYTPPQGMSDEAAKKSRQAVATMAKELKDNADKWWAATQTVKGQIEAGEGKVAGELNLASATFNVNNAVTQEKPVDVPGAKDGNFYRDWYPRSSTPASTEAAAATAVDPNAPKLGPPSPGEKPLQPDPRAGSLTGNLGVLGITEPKSPLDQPRQPLAPKLDPNSPQGKAAIDQMRGYLRKIYPPAEAEQRLQDAIKGSQQDRPMVAVPEGGPQERVKETFADAYRASWDEGIKGIQDMVGANGLDDFKEVWKNTGEGLLHQLNPINNVIDGINEAKSAIDNPEAFLGHKSAIASQAIPGLMLGGEGALARIGLEDAALTGARSELTHGIPDTHHAPSVGDHTPPSTGDHSLPHAPHTPVPHEAPAPAPLHPEHPLFDGYHPADPGPKYTNPDGSLRYPDAADPTKPYAVPGTVVDNAQLPKGTVLGRFGYPGGEWLAPEGTPFAKLALPNESALKPYFQYIVEDPTKLPPGWRIEQSQVAPWFNQPGMGPQYRIIAPVGERASTQELLEWGFLGEVR